jgi:hypothetical protein
MRSFRFEIKAIFFNREGALDSRNALPLYCNKTFEKLPAVPTKEGENQKMCLVHKWYICSRVGVSLILTTWTQHILRGFSY